MRRAYRRKNARSRLLLLLLPVAILTGAILWDENYNAASANTGLEPTDEVSVSAMATSQTNANSANSAPVNQIPIMDALNSALVSAAGAKVGQLIQATLPTQAQPPTPITFNGKGTVEDGHFYSPILNRVMPYRIYMPPNYATSGQRYPVLYMLHGLSGSYLEWIDYKLFDTVDALIAQGKIKPIIIVLPSGDQEYWVDHANGGLQWGEYVVHDVVGYIDANYRTIPNRDNRAIGGHSMGGHGSLQLAFNHPEIFSVVGAHSPTLRTKDQAAPYFGDEAYYEAHDPVSLAKSLPDSTLKSLKIWVDIGTQDNTWRPRAEELNQVLTERGIPHQFNIWEGGHEGAYWISHVAQYLQFYADNLAGK